jgi:site-specific recombinase XerD
MKGFNGPFAILLGDFVDLKHSTGYKYIKEAAYLQRFGNYCVAAGITEPSLTKELADGWCVKLPHEQGRNDTQQRISCLRQFALYLVSLGKDAYIPINQPHIRQRKSNFSVYVFSHEEMDTIFKQSNNIYPNRRSTMHLVMPVLIRLLYSSGLRVMEALTLQLKNLDLSEGVICIINAKFNKDRFLPLSSSMSAVLVEYCGIMHPLNKPDDYLFVGISRNPLTHHIIYTRFRELLVMAGIQHAGRGNGPRIHDVRHTFCCHTLQEAVNSGRDLTNMLPLLSEYLGHESLTATSRYLRMTAEVYPSVLETVERLCAHIIPEVKQ